MKHGDWISCWQSQVSNSFLDCSPTDASWRPEVSNLISSQCSNCFSKVSQAASSDCTDLSSQSIARMLGWLGAHGLFSLDYAWWYFDSRHGLCINWGLDLATRLPSGESSAFPASMRAVSSCCAKSASLEDLVSRLEMNVVNFSNSCIRGRYQKPNNCKINKIKSIHLDVP